MAENIGGVDFRARWTQDARAAAIADPARRVAISLPSPASAGSERSMRETLSRLPGEVTSFKILGKSVGDLGKEAAISGTAGALLRMGLGATAGVAGFTAVPVWGIAAAGGGIMGGVREHFKRTNETWARMRQEQGREVLGVVNKKLGKGDTLKGFFNPDQKRSITFAIMRGSAFGGAGNVAGGWVAETAVGQAVKGVFSGVGEAKDEFLGGVGGLKDAIGAARSADTSGGAAAATPTETPTPTATSTATPTPTATEVPKTATALPPSPTVQPTPAETQTSVPHSIPEALGRGIPFIGKPLDAVAGGFHNVGLKAHEITGWGLDAGKTFVDHSQYFKGRMEITDSSPDWVKNINSLDGEYGRAIQGTVVENLPEQRVKAQEIAHIIMDERGQPYYTYQTNAISNHIQHIMEDQANKAFDSNLQSLVDRGVNLNELTQKQFEEMIKEEGRKKFEEWLRDKATDDITEGVKAILNTEDQIKQVLSQGQGLVAEVRPVPAGTNVFDVVAPPNADTDIEFLKKIIPNMTANIAANEGVLTGWYWEGNPERVYPAYLGELNYLMKKAEEGNLEALLRLKDAFKSVRPSDSQFKMLTPEGIKRVLEILRQLG
ncbi:MAG: hypothetical protein G01um10147_624 [Microgenomates group bacterium Gr01-1014_7]|nr:MAG: hypothetical protein G01um10147_624 [Microgenomates group bacterium Gr01-1014_7]